MLLQIPLLSESFCKHFLPEYRSFFNIIEWGGAPNFSSQICLFHVYLRVYLKMTLPKMKSQVCYPVHFEYVFICLKYKALAKIHSVSDCSNYLLEGLDCCLHQITLTRTCAFVCRTHMPHHMPVCRSGGSFWGLVLSSILQGLGLKLRLSCLVASAFNL